MPDNPDRIAIFYGPTLLAANLAPVNDPQATDPFYVPALVTQNRAVTDWVKPIAIEQLTFKTDGVGRPHDVELVPFYRLHDRRYTVYFDAFSREEWSARETNYRVEQARLKALEARTVDTLRIGEMQPERDHLLKGENTQAGEAFGRKWRHAVDGGWFGFELEGVPSEPQELMVTYWGSDGGNRVFDLLVNERKLATQRLQNNRPNQFYEEVYAISADLAGDSGQLRIRFQAHPGATAGGVFGVRLVRAEGSADE